MGETATYLLPWPEPPDPPDIPVDLEQLAQAVEGAITTVIASGIVAPLVSSLPAGPADGQRCIYLASAANGILWHLRYRAASPSPYKWEFLGGSSLADIQTVEGTKTAGASYGAATNAGPVVTVPLAGEYDVTLSAYMLNSNANATGYYSFSVGATGAIDADSIRIREDGNGGNGASTSAGTRRKIVPAAATALTAAYKCDVGTLTMNVRAMNVVPVRVG